MPPDPLRPGAEARAERLRRRFAAVSRQSRRRPIRFALIVALVALVGAILGAAIGAV